MKTASLSIIAIALIAIAAALITGMTGLRTVTGSAPLGLASTVATSGTLAVTGTASTLFSTSTSGCSDRVISTGAASVWLTFTDKDTPAVNTGIFQATGTTVVYDCGLFGNGKVKAASGANQNVFAQEAR